jgi:hypothetical protein
VSVNLDGEGFTTHITTRNSRINYLNKRYNLNA